MSSPGPATQAGSPPAPPSAEPFGPNSVEVGTFIAAVGRLTGAQWRKVVAARGSTGLIVRDPSAQPAETVRSMLKGANGDEPAAEPLSPLASALAGALDHRTDEEVVATWQAASALTRRRQLSPLTFAAHYVPFAAVVPLAITGELPQSVERFTKGLRWLGADAWQALARPWTLDRDASGSLLQASVKSRTREAEEAAALAALAVAPKHLTGDAGWAAVKTAVHGARVLGCKPELTAEQLIALWAPLEEAVALRSLDDQPGTEKKRTVRAPALDVVPVPKKRTSGKVYGANHTEVAAFVKAVSGLTAIQWLRVLDRRLLVASVARKQTGEPAAVVQASLAAIRGTRELDLDARSRVLAAVERAGYALDSKHHLTAEQALQHYGAVAEVIPFGDVDAPSFAAHITALNREEWVRLAGAAPAADPATMSPLVHAGDALADYLGGRSDDEVAVTWQALTALINRHLLSPIKFAVSFAPFASGVTVIKAKSLGPTVQRYLTAVGRLSAHQCTILAEPWLVADDVSSKLSAALVAVSTRPAEEAAALAALVTVPMRLTGDPGWAAAKTAAFGARVVACRAQLSEADLSELWKPLERAIPFASLEGPSKLKARLP